MVLDQDLFQIYSISNRITFKCLKIWLRFHGWIIWSNQTYHGSFDKDMTKLTKAVGNIKGACLNMLLLQSHNIEKYCLSQYCSDSSVWKDL